MAAEWYRVDPTRNKWRDGAIIAIGGDFNDEHYADQFRRLFLRKYGREYTAKLVTSQDWFRAMKAAETGEVHTAIRR